MNAKELYEKIYTRIAREGFLKALLIGGSIGFLVMAVIAFVSWFFPFNGLLLSILGGMIVGIGLTALLYFKAFKPTKKSIAKRLDQLGFEERFITMTEFEDKEDYIYKRQREDAKTALKRTSRKKIAIKIPIAAIVAAALTFTAGASLSVIEGLSENGVIESGSKVINRVVDPLSPDDYISLSYIVEEGGYIEGEADQVFKKGCDGTTVIAVEDEDWIFKCWTDEAGNEISDDPVRTDIKITEDTVYIAVFQLAEGEGEGSGENEGENGNEGEPPDEPISNKDRENNPPDDNIDSPIDNGKNPGYIPYENNNLIMDDIYYRDILEEIIEKLKDESMSLEERKALEAYLKAIK